MADFYDSRSFVYYKNQMSFMEKLKKLSNDSVNRNKNYEPVYVRGNGKKICNSWWGDAWCRNLERYADLENRINRGKSYLKIGAVVDLKIYGGRIYAKVQGNKRTPYSIKITIDPLNERSRKRLEQQAVGKIQNLEALMNGTFPEDLKDVFFQENALFPAPNEIHFNCTCPDWAHMCKHVTAALYGIGIRLDDDPLYFFQMRNINVDDFIAKVVGGKIEVMLENANVVETSRIMKNPDLTKLFGI